MLSPRQKADKTVSRERRVNFGSILISIEIRLKFDHALFCVEPLITHSVCLCVCEIIVSA